MIILRDKIYSKDESKDNLDSTSKKYLVGAAGLAGTGGYLVGTSGRKSFEKGVKAISKVTRGKKQLESKEVPELIESLAAKGIGDPEVYREEIRGLYDRHFKGRSKALKNLKSKLRTKRSIGQYALAGAAGLTAAAGYRYYKNKKDNNHDNKN